MEKELLEIFGRFKLQTENLGRYLLDFKSLSLYIAEYSQGDINLELKSIHDSLLTLGKDVLSIETDLYCLNANLERKEKDQCPTIST